MLTLGYLSSARGLQPWPTAQHSPPYPAAAGRARSRSRTPRLSREKGPVPRSLSAMVSACSHLKTSLQNLPGRDRGNEERKQVLVTREKQTVPSFMLGNSQYFWGHVFETSGNPQEPKAALEHCWPWGSCFRGTHIKTPTPPSQQILQLPRCFSSKCKAHFPK